MTGEKISVCLLTYNHANVIESTLKSILEQSLADYEIIVSDDCSSDGTWGHILEIAARNPRITPVQTPHNMGMAGNANFAVAESSRPYIALLHHDDLCRKDLLEKWLKTIEQHPDMAFVFNPYAVYESDFVYSESIPSGRLDGQWLLKNYLFPRWGCAVRGTAMIRRQMWDNVGGMREQFGLLADVDLWMRFSAQWSVGYVAEPVIIIRQDRPDDYPDIYKQNHWSWQRRRYLHEIHASNRLAFLKLNTIPGRLQWWWFRCRLSLDTAKWLTYAVVKRNKPMLTSAVQSETTYDLLPLRAYRKTLLYFQETIRTEHG